MSSRLKALAVTLPIVLLVFMVGRAEWQLAHSDTWFFAIRGYDPRDLLRGHYMQFRLSIAPDETLEACSVGDPSCCYCLEDRDRTEAYVILATCETAMASCDDYVQTRPLHALDRFYIPEEGRVEMETKLRDAALAGRAHLSVAVDETGQPMIDGLWVDGEPISVDAVESPGDAPSPVSPDTARPTTRAPANTMEP